MLHEYYNITMSEVQYALTTYYQLLSPALGDELRSEVILSND